MNTEHYMTCDVRDVIRAMLLGLAPKDHRRLSVSQLVQIGYSETTAEAMAEAYAQQNPAPKIK